MHDDTGRELLDFTSGQMCATIPPIVDAVHKAGVSAFHMFSGMIPEVVAELARSVARDWMPAGLTKSIFVKCYSIQAQTMQRLHGGDRAHLWLSSHHVMNAWPQARRVWSGCGCSPIAPRHCPHLTYAY